MAPPESECHPGRAERSAAKSIPVIGLVGAIGAGKSAVAGILRELGCVVSDSDALAREALRDPEVARAVQARWGEGVTTSDGAVDRARVADIVFADEGERRWLESVVHPWIKARREAAFASAPAGAPALVIDAPLLQEAGLDATCDAVIYVDAPAELRRARVLAERGWTAKELHRRESSQWTPERKRAAATHVIPNDGDRAELRRHVEMTLREIVESGAFRPDGAAT